MVGNVKVKQEKWRGQQRYIGILELKEGRNRPPRVIRTQPEIEEQISNFYTDLYRERVTESSRDEIKQYESFSDVGESRVWFASKNLTPCRMH